MFQCNDESLTILFENPGSELRFGECCPIPCSGTQFSLDYGKSGTLFPQLIENPTVLCAVGENWF